jgi:hypothetical protein
MSFAMVVSGNPARCGLCQGPSRPCILGASRAAFRGSGCRLAGFFAERPLNWQHQAQPRQPGEEKRGAHTRRAQPSRVGSRPALRDGQPTLPTPRASRAPSPAAHYRGRGWEPFEGSHLKKAHSLTFRRHRRARTSGRARCLGRLAARPACRRRDSRREADAG